LDLENLKIILPFIVSFCSVLIWPVILIFLLFFFRENLTKDLKNIGKDIFLKKTRLPGGAEFEFEEKKQQNFSSVIETPSKKIVEALRKSIVDSEQEIKNLRVKSEVLEIKLHFENINKFIFQSQYDLLQILERSDNKKVSIDYLAKHFQSTPLSKKAEWNISRYLAFLSGSGLVNIEVEDKEKTVIKITDLGELYLEYTQEAPIICLRH